jgi:Icc-related predicted phosphoesterase
MKILCISDQIDPLIYSNNAKERFQDIDLVLSAGDLPMEYIDYVVSTLNRPTLFVFGNHNLKNFNRFHGGTRTKKRTTIDDSTTHLSGAAYVGFKVLKEGNLLIAGASGSLEYNGGESQYSDGEMNRKLIKMIPRLLYNKLRYGRYLDIFLTHAPPLGIHDKEDRCHTGFKSFLWFMRIFKPKYLIHGHIHLYDLQDIRVSVYEQTTIVNAFSHHIIRF